MTQPPTLANSQEMHADWLALLALSEIDSGPPDLLRAGLPLGSGWSIEDIRKWINHRKKSAREAVWPKGFPGLPKGLEKFVKENPAVSLNFVRRASDIKISDSDLKALAKIPQTKWKEILTAVQKNEVIQKNYAGYVRCDPAAKEATHPILKKIVESALIGTDAMKVVGAAVTFIGLALVSAGSGAAEIPALEAIALFIGIHVLIFGYFLALIWGVSNLLLGMMLIWVA